MALMQVFNRRDHVAYTSHEVSLERDMVHLLWEEEGEEEEGIERRGGGRWRWWEE